jgi:hypothetical protein
MPTYLQQVNSDIFNSTNRYSVLNLTPPDTSVPSIYSPSRFQPAPFATSTPDRSQARNPVQARRELKVMTINCNSLVSIGKRAEFQSLIDKHQPHIILGQESKLGPEHSNSEIFPTKYNIKRKDRKAGGGGVFVMTREDLNCNEDAFDNIESEVEVVWAQIKMHGTKVLNVASVYRPPNSSVEYMKKLQNHFRQVHQQSKNSTYIIGGNMNLTQIDWVHDGPIGNQPGTADTNLCSMFIDIMDDLGLSQHCQDITRPASNKILDLVLTNQPSSCRSVNSLPGISDHNLVLATFHLSPSRTKLPQRRILKFDKADWPNINKSVITLSTEYFNRNPNSHTVEENCKFIEEGITSIIANEVPSKLSKSKETYPWITPEVKKILKKRDRLYIQATKTRSPEKWNSFKEHRQMAKNAIRSSHQDYITNMIGTELQENQKPFWKYIKSLRKDNQNIPTLKVKDMAPAASDQSKANALVDQFSSVFTQEDIQNTPTLTQVFPDMPNITFGEEGIQKLLSNIKPQKAGGPDNLPARFLKENAKELAPMYQHLFAQSYNCGVLPKTWCEAIVCPIFKKGPKYLPENYRPVSLTAIPCKLLEHIIVSKVWEHLNKYDIISKVQHGFRSGLSCTTQLIGAIDDWAKELNIGESQMDVIVLDFSKAFDKVPHRRLIQKMKCYGITNKNQEWIENFLTNRQHQVVINGTTSKIREVTSGVPQGTVLGPLLFLLYINDIEKDLTSSIRLFADDSAVYRRIDTEEDAHALQLDLFRLQEWADKWQMSFNVAKCKTLRITRKKKNKVNFEYCMSTPSSTESAPVPDQVREAAKNILTTSPPNGKFTALGSITSDKYLGVTLDHHLSFNDHIDNIAKKATTLLNLCRRNLHMCSTNVKEQAYKAIVRPHLEYASPAWNPHTSRNINRLEQVQRRAARFVLRNYDYNNDAGLSHQIDHQLKWPSLQHRRAHTDLVTFYKIRHQLIKMPFPATVQTSPIHPHRFLHIQGQSSNAYLNSFFPRTIRIWNISLSPPSNHQVLIHLHPKSTNTSYP